MKTLSVFLTVLAFVLGGASITAAAEVSAGADFVSGYVWRGMTFNDGLVIQPWLDVSANGFAVNVWGNYDVHDYHDTLDDSEFSEIDWTLSYDFTLEPVNLSVGHIEYLFPGSDTPGTGEVFLSAGISPVKGLSAGIDIYYDYDEVEDYYLSAGPSYDYEFDCGFSVGAGARAGYAGDNFSIGPDDGFHEYTLSVNTSCPVTEGVR